MSSQPETTTSVPFVPSARAETAVRTLAVVQSNYIPWKGYFDLIHMVDEFILFDDVQYTRRDWRNRNTIKTAHGPAWLTIPVNAKGNYLTAIKDITVSDADWGRRHWSALTASYGKAPHFGTYKERFQEAYLDTRERRLSAINRRFLDLVCDVLGIRTRLSWSMDYQFDRFQDDRSRRLAELCKRAGATRYVSGPTARGYLDEELFAREGIEVVFLDYSGYPEYPQAHPPFDHHVSILDLLFNTGPDAPRYMLSFR
jgi:hypothetical protein